MRMRTYVDTSWSVDNQGVSDVLNCLLDLTEGEIYAFTMGAAWMAGGLAVCEFLSDLAAQVNACPECHGGLVDVPWDTCTLMVCNTCNGTGKRVAP